MALVHVRRKLAENPDLKEFEMRKVLEIGGLVAGAVLIAFGIAAIALGFSGRSTVGSELKQQQITGSSDMTPSTIKSDAQAAGLKNVSLPTCNVAGKAVVDGATARCFAQYMRIHALESTGGYVYSQMGIYLAAPDAPKAQLMPGGGTDNAQFALKDSKTGQPMQNSARNVWVTETALSTALNMSYMATQIALFGIVVGFALLLSGFGFAILAIGGALRNPENALNHIFDKRKSKVAGTTPVPTA